MYSSQHFLYALSLGTIVNVFFKSKRMYLLLLCILLSGFIRDTWIFVAIQSVSYFLYETLNNKQLPVRMATLNLLWIVTVVIWSQRQVLQLPDLLKMNCFFLSWILGLIYFKNKLLLAWKLVRRSKIKQQ